MGNPHLEMTVLMTPDMVNFGGNVHGGHLLKLMDNVAFACAAQYAGGPAVTLSVDQVLFKEPVHVGELVSFFASINCTGNTSMEVGIRVEALDLLKNKRRHTNTSYFTMVAMSEAGKPRPVEKLLVNNDTAKRRCMAAEKRRDFRREVQKKSDEIRGKG